jgi:hypothetical protein
LAGRGNITGEIERWTEQIGRRDGVIFAAALLSG